ncbi:MAG: M23 family metallopeptidase [Patescibacteria group bacterium]|nr:M23 family metallopeptidase [Patescibacteria group bacterium]
MAAFFISLLWRTGRIILRFIFYRIVVKAYQLYLYLLKKLGMSGSNRNKSLPWLINQKSVHFIVTLLTIILTVFNLTGETQAISSEELAGKTLLAKLVTSEFGETEEFIEEYFDEEAIISSIQQTYLDNLVSMKSRPMAEMKAPDEIDLGKEAAVLTQGGSAVIKPELAATSKIRRLRRDIIYYTVNPGDTISTIAAEFGISVNTILWENNLSAYSLIRPGDKLSILPITGVTHKVVRGDNLSKITKKYNVKEDKIIQANKLTDGSKLTVGQKLIIPSGRKIKYASYASSGYTGLSAIKNLVSPTSAKPVSGNKMNWPTKGHRITQYYSWRHHGLDIANKTGTPIYAADAGAIEYIGWGRGYGNQIVISHGGGKKTRYAHLSKFYVKKGQKINKGETIAAMGSTGWSTGPHLHFEVIINGRKYNPLNYIK